MRNNHHRDAKQFASQLSQVELNNRLRFGSFLLEGRHGVSSSIQYNQAGLDLLNNRHEYTFPINDGELQVSMQLYKNDADHYRLFCYTNINNIQGMAFSVNLTTEKESHNIIHLTQTIKFTEQYDGDEQLAKEHRRQKQTVFCDILRKTGLEVTDNNLLILGIFDPERNQLVNTSAEKFLNDFLVVSILKAHFQGNKGFQIEILPSYRIKNNYTTTSATQLTILPDKAIKTKTRRTIPLGMRYHVLHKDSFKCKRCGRSADDGIILHIDHIKPVSLGGLTELSNLRTLCNECNIGRSNRFTE